jgi:hypothetical protein
MSVGKIQKQSKADYQTAAVKAKEGAQQVASEFANFVANFAASFEKYGDFKASLQKQQHLDDAQLAVFLRDQNLHSKEKFLWAKKNSRCLVAAPKKKKKKAVACSCRDIRALQASGSGHTAMQDCHQALLSFSDVYLSPIFVFITNSTDTQCRDVQ